MHTYSLIAMVLVLVGVGAAATRGGANSPREGVRYAGRAILVAALQVPVTVPATGTIPRDPFRTWSLFLVCDAAWLRPEKAAELHRLYAAFQRFGTNIGRKNAAIWFWKAKMLASDANLPANVDVDRSVAFCQQLALAPSQGPYVVWTPAYPTEPLPTVSDKSKRPQVIGLGGMSASAIEDLLRRTGDNLARDSAVGPLPQQAFVIRFVSAAQQALMDFGCSFKVKFTAALVTAELRDCGQ